MDGKNEVDELWTAMIRYRTVGTVGAGVPLVVRLSEDPRALMDMERELKDAVDADQMVSTGGAAVDPVHARDNRVRMVLLVS